MRILATADLHGDREIYKWLVRASKNVQPEVVVLAGDLLGYPDGYSSIDEAQRANASDILSILEGVGVPVLFVMGNDDFVDLEPPGPHFQALHGRRFERQGFNFVGYPYSWPFMGGIFEKPEAEIEEDLSVLARQVDESTVPVTRSPVSGILDIRIMDAHAGSKALGRMVELKNPVAHIHGHIHSSFGVNGRPYNVAAAWKRRAIVLDLENQSHEIISKTEA